MARKLTPSRRELARLNIKKEKGKSNYKRYFILFMAIFIVLLFLLQSLLPFIK